MAVLDQSGSDNPQNFDLSFMVTTRCNLHCSFCMYNSGPEVSNCINWTNLRHWLQTVDADRIASFGLYGGEPSIALPMFGKALEMARFMLGRKPAFLITNGSWSTDAMKTEQFLSFCEEHHNLLVVVSGTPEHRKFQNREVLEFLAFQRQLTFRLKPVEENFQAMGRLEGKMPFSCSQKCMSWNRAMRIAVQPDGSILFQNCDGVYPVVGSIREPFSTLVRRIDGMREHGFADCCSHYQTENKKAA